MQSKNVKQSRIHRLFGIKVKSKLAAAYMDTAVKVLICVVCGALFLTGIYGVIQKVVLPKTESSVNSMFAYEAADTGNGGGAGGSGGVEAPGVNEDTEMPEGENTINGSSESLLPAEYQQVEYIESTGTQWIDTGFIADNNTKVNIDFQITEITPTFVFGSRTSSSSNAYTLSISNLNNTLCSAYGVGSDGNGGYYSIMTPADLSRHTVTKSGRTQYLDTVWQNAYEKQTFTTPGSLELFACYNNGTEGYKPSKIKLYSCQIYDGCTTATQTLVRDFVPCYRKADNVVGLYDLVEDKFYENQGTEEFTSGSNIDYVDNISIRNKTLAIFGTSVSQGTNYSDNKSYIHLMQQSNNMNIASYAMGGKGITYALDKLENNLDTIKSLSEDDYVILEGFANDAVNIDLGTLTEVGTTEFDETTFIGALESFIYQYQKFGCKAKFGIYICHKSTDCYTGEDAAISNALWNKPYKAALQVCEKYNVPYLDLSETTYEIELGDHIHPTLEGYKFIQEKVEKWLNTL